MWIETTKKEYSALFSYFKKDLIVHGSITDIDGSSPFGNGSPHIQTDWGTTEKKYPALRCDQTKEDENQKDWDAKFYIYYPEKDDLETEKKI